MDKRTGAYSLPATPLTVQYQAQDGRQLEYAKRPIGAPPVTELRPRTPSQQIRSKHRAAALIQKYAGHNWREAQRTKWLLDVVLHIDNDYKAYIKEQADEIETLHQQLQQVQTSNSMAVQALSNREAQLEDTLRELEQQLHTSHEALLDMQSRMAAGEQALQEAEEAAAVAAEECRQLQEAVLALSEHDAATRKLLANRSHALKEALLTSRAHVRQGNEQARRGELRLAATLKLQELSALKERLAAQEAARSQLAALAVVERASARLEVEQLRMELDAYKEPWEYMFKNKSPTRNKELSKELGLKQGSMNVLVPF